MNEEIKKIKGYSGSAPVAGVGGAITNMGISQNGVQPITSTGLQPAEPFKLAPSPVTSAANAITGMSSAVKDSAVKQNEADRKLAEIETAKTNDSDVIKSLYDEYANVQGSRQTLENQAGLDQKAQKVTDYTNRLEASERAQQNEIRALEQGAGTGMTSQGKADAIQAINRRYAFEQADLAVLQSAANRDFATAQSIVDRKIELQLEPLKTKLEARKFSYQENKDAYSTAEQRKIEADLKKEEREYNESREKIKAEETRKLKQMEIEQKANEYKYQELPDGRAVMLDKEGNIVREVSKAPVSKEEKEALAAQVEQEKMIPSLRQKEAQIKSLIDSGSYKKIVGTTDLGRTPRLSALTGEAQDALGSIKQLTSRETLDTLINLKKSGGTLGALSDGERQTLEAAATKINAWEVKDPKTGIGTGRYNASESSFKKELETLLSLTQKAIDSSIGITKENPLGLDLPADPLGLGI